MRQDYNQNIESKDDISSKIEQKQHKGREAEKKSASLRRKSSKRLILNNPQAEVLKKKSSLKDQEVNINRVTLPKDDVNSVSNKSTPRGNTPKSNPPNKTTHHNSATSSKPPKTNDQKIKSHDVAEERVNLHQATSKSNTCNNHKQIAQQASTQKMKDQSSWRDADLEKAYQQSRRYISNLKEGSKVYIISCKWWDKFKQYQERRKNTGKRGSS